MTSVKAVSHQIDDSVVRFDGDSELKSELDIKRYKRRAVRHYVTDINYGELTKDTISEVDNIRGSGRVRNHVIDEEVINEGQTLEIGDKKYACQIKVYVYFSPNNSTKNLIARQLTDGERRSVSDLWSHHVSDYCNYTRYGSSYEVQTSRVLSRLPMDASKALAEVFENCGTIRIDVDKDEIAPQIEESNIQDRTNIGGISVDAKEVKKDKITNPSYRQEIGSGLYLVGYKTSGEPMNWLTDGSGEPLLDILVTGLYNTPTEHLYQLRLHGSGDILPIVNPTEGVVATIPEDKVRTVEGDLRKNPSATRFALNEAISGNKVDWEEYNKMREGRTKDFRKVVDEEREDNESINPGLKTKVNSGEMDIETSNTEYSGVSVERVTDGLGDFIEHGKPQATLTIPLENEVEVIVYGTSYKSILVTPTLSPILDVIVIGKNVTEGEGILHELPLSTGESAWFFPSSPLRNSKIISDAEAQVIRQSLSKYDEEIVAEAISLLQTFDVHSYYEMLRLCLIERGETVDDVKPEVEVSDDLLSEIADIEKLKNQGTDLSGPEVQPETPNCDCGEKYIVSDRKSKESKLLLKMTCPSCYSRTVEKYHLKSIKDERENEVEHWPTQTAISEYDCGNPSLSVGSFQSDDSILIWERECTNCLQKFNGYYEYIPASIRENM